MIIGFVSPLDQQKNRLMMAYEGSIPEAIGLCETIKYELLRVQTTIGTIQ